MEWHEFGRHDDREASMKFFSNDKLHLFPTHGDFAGSPEITSMTSAEALGEEKKAGRNSFELIG